MDGEQELPGRRTLANEWLGPPKAPHKQLVTDANGGHAIAMEHADELHRILQEVILPETLPGQ